MVMSGKWGSICPKCGGYMGSVPCNSNLDYRGSFPCRCIKTWKKDWKGELKKVDGDEFESRVSAILEAQRENRKSGKKPKSYGGITFG